MPRTPLAVILLASVATPALAQTAAPLAPPVDTAVSGEIIVTARKREERLQDVPLTINVVGQETIERANLQNISDLASQTPGFSYKQGFGRTGSGGGAGVRPSIRGMSSVVGAPNAAFFVDGIFVSDNIASYALDNLERVEVIKGPQSALFGRGTFSGAVNYVTRLPTNDPQMRIRLNVATFDSVEATASVSGPIVRDMLLLEVNARTYRFGGDYVNADQPTDKIGKQSSRNVSGRLLFRPSSNFDALLSVGYSEDRDGGYVYGFQGSAQNNCFAPPIVGTIPFPRTNTSRRGFFCGEVKTLPSYAYNDDFIEGLGYSGLVRNFLRTSLKLNLTTDSGFTFTSISAFNRNNSITGQDNTLRASANPSVSVDESRTRDYSQELRIASPQDKRIRALLGGYYYREETLSGFSLLVASNGQRPFDSDDGVRSTSVFGLVEADLTDRLTVSGEARYQWEKIIGSTEVLGVPGGPSPAPIQIREARFNAFLPRATIRYEVSPRLNLYASAAKGNKPGGFNNFPADASAADIATFNQRGFDVFGEESAWSYEIGAKGRVGRVNFGASAFLIDWSNQQLSRGESYTRTNGTPNSVAFIQNAGQSRIKGFEAEVSGNPAPWLYLRLGYTFVDARFTRFYDDTTEEIFDTDGRPALINGVRNPLDVDGLSGGDVSGNFLPQTPRHQAIATGQVTLPVADRLSFFTRGDLAYESRRFTQVDNLNWAGDSFNLNGSLGLEGTSWTASLFARNLLQDKTPLVVTRLLDFSRLITRVNPLTGLNQTTFFRDFTVSAPRRRQFGVTFTYKY